MGHVSFFNLSAIKIVKSLDFTILIPILTTMIENLLFFIKKGHAARKVNQQQQQQQQRLIPLGGVGYMDQLPP